ncbi:MAG: NADH-quinone oxidoreductase subunit C [Actinomycetota bacterium]
MRAEEIVERLGPRFPDAVVARGQAVLSVEREHLLDELTSVRDDADLRLDFLSSVTATDWPERTPRFWLAYELYSVEHKHRLRVKVGLPDEDPRVPSVTGLFPTANFQEREVFDLFGIGFDGHPDLRRILMPEGWEGYPLRKTEELGGVNTQYKGAFIPPVDKRTV